MEGAYCLQDSYSIQKAINEFCLANLAFEGQIWVKESRVPTSVWKLRQPQNGSRVVKFLWASEVGKSKLGKFKEIQFQSFRVYAMQIKIMFEVFLILTILLKGFMQKSFSCFSCFFYIPVTKLSKWPHFYVLRSSIKSGSEIMTLRVLHLTLGSSGETLL